MNKFIKRATLTALLSAGAAASVMGFTACAGKSTATEAPSDTEITRLQPPADGSLPTAHTAEENLAYMAYVLDSQPQYHCYTYTVTQASIATQYTKSYKDYRDGVTISSDITYSSMVKSGSQACFVNGKNGPEAYMRYSAAPDSETTNLTAQWDTGEPYYFDEQAYLTTYGLFQTEITNYIINGVTITDSTAATDNGDGTYSQSVTLDPAASTYYYQYGMKTRGGLNGFPEFQTINLTFTFDGDWRVLSVQTDEVAKVNKGITVTSTSRSSAEYSYDEADFDEAHYAFYDSYFKQYVGNSNLSSGGGSAALDVTSVLSNGFSGILNGGQQFEVALKLGQNEYKGYIFLGLDIADPLNTLNLKLSLGKTLEEQGLYVEYADGKARAYYGDDFGMTANIAAVKLVVDNFAQWADELNSALALSSDGGGGSGLSLPEGALDGLLSSLVLTQGDGTASLALNDGNLLGLGAGVDAVLNFTVGENNAVSFSSASVSGVSIGGDGIDLALSLSTTDAPVISHDPNSAEADLALYAADIYNLLSSDLIEVKLSLDGSSEQVKLDALKGLKADATAYVDANGLAAGADADISYTYQGREFSASVSAYYSYEPQTYGDIILNVTSLNGKEVNLSVGCAAGGLSDAVNALLNAANIKLGGTEADEQDVSAGIADIINNVLSADFSQILGGLSADGARISLSCNLDEILGLFGVEGSFGNVGLTYNYGGVLSAELPALGLSLSAQGAEGELEVPSDGYLALDDLISVVTQAYATINGIIENGAINIVIPADGNLISYGDMSLDVTGSVSARWKGNTRVAADINVKFAGASDAATTNLKIIYNRTTDADTPLVRLSINGAALDIYADDLAGVQSQISSLALATDSSEEGEEGLVSLILDMLAGGEWIDFLNSLTLTSDGRSLALGYIGDATANVTLGTQGGLSLGIDAVYEKFSYNGQFNLVRADVYSYVNGQIEQSSPASTKNGDGIIKVVYDYIFDAFNAVDLTEVLGGAYALDFSLNGDNSAIPALSGVQVNANLAFGGYDESSNAAGLDVWVKVNGVEVKFNITLIGEQFYVSVTNITGKEIPHLKITTTANSLYSLLSDLVGTAVQSGLLGGAYPASANASAESSVTDILYSLATTDFSQFITCTSTTAAKTMIVDVDGLLAQFGVNAGFVVGSVTAVLNEDLTFSASAEYAGKQWLSIGAHTQDTDFSQFDTSGFIDFSQVTAVPVVDILNLIGSDNLKVELDLSHAFGEHNVAISAGVAFNASQEAVSADISLAYEYGGMPVSANLSIYYIDNAAYVRVTAINGSPVSLGVYCDIAELSTAIGNLLSVAQLDISSGMPQVDVDLSDLAANLITADFSSILTGVYSDKQMVKADIDMDSLLSQLGLNAPALGSLSLVFADGKLSGTADEIGLSVTLSGAEGVDKPSGEYLNLSDLVNFVTEAYTQVNGIINDGALAFAIDKNSPAYITIDGITAAVYGNGEIGWAQGDNTVALDLAISLAENSSADELALKLVYNGNAAQSDPIVTLAINNVGLSITRADIDGVTDKINKIVSAVSVLTGSNGGAATLSARSAATRAASHDDLVLAVLSLISGTDWASALNDMTLTADGHSVVLGWAAENFVAVSAGEEGITLSYSAAAEGNGAALATGAELTLSKSSKKLAQNILAELEDDYYSIASSSGGDNFIKLVYDNLFEAIRSISVDSILGNNVYNVSFDLDGSKTGVEDMKDIFVHAEMYVKNNTYGGTVMQLDLNFNIKGAVVNGSVIIDNDKSGKNTNFYIDLTQVLNITLNGLRVKASQETLYETVRSLVDLICDTDMLKTVAGFIPSQTVEAQSAVALSQEGKNSLSDILYGLLTTDFASAITGATNNGATVVTVDLDAIFGGMGLSVGSLGALECAIDHSTHAITSSAVAEGQSEEWLSLSSARLTESQITSFSYALKNIDTAQYIDIAFLPSLVDDLSASLTNDGGEMYDSITFEGQLTANIVSILDVTVSNLSLTVNLAPDNFYFSLQGTLESAKFLGITVISKHDIGLTFQNGYLTLYRNAGSGDEYRVMTLEYFLDNMFGEGDTLNWLLKVEKILGIDVWGMIADSVPEVSSGLTTPGSFYLYSKDGQAVYEEISVTDYVKALSAVIAGEEVLDFVAQNASTDTMLSNLGIRGDNNYYAFDLNASLLTDDVLTVLSAAIMRADNGGIEGLKAYGEIQSYVTFNVDLSYSEGAEGVSSHYSYVEQNFAGFNTNDKSADEIFGCYNSADNSFAYSKLLTPYTLTVRDVSGAVIDTYTVREGSEVYLYDNAYPVYADESGQFRLVYTKDGQLCTHFTMTGDAEVVAVRRLAKDFEVVNLENYAQDFTYHSFVGDTLPQSFAGFTAVNSFVFEETDQPIAGVLVEQGTPTVIVGTYAPAVQTVNYVNYEFDAATASYRATGMATGFRQYYVQGNRTLVLESSICGLPVTAIADGAFSNTDGDETKSIKNVIVPASITHVGKQAFLDNSGMQSAIFLAPEVYFAGTDKEVPFYGCSAQKDGTSTLLNVYYTSAQSDGDWTYFRDGGYKIGSDGGSLHSGDWSYVSGVEVNDSGLLNSVTIDGLSFAQYAGNNLPAGVILHSDVQSVFGTYQTILQEALDAFTLKQSGLTNVYVVALSVSGSGASEHFVATVSQGTPVENVGVNVISKVNFTYGATEYKFSSSNNFTAQVMAEVQSGSIINSKTPAANGYVFLGWATEVEGQLEFTTLSDPSLTYYAIWAVEKDGVTYSLHTQGSTVSLPVYSSGTFYGWYGDSEYSNLISTEALLTLSVDNTVLNIRRQFTLSVSVAGGTDNGFTNKKTFYYINENKVAEGTSCSAGDYVLFEGEKVTVTQYTSGSDSGYAIGTVNGEIRICAWLMTRSSWFGSWSKSSVHNISPSVSDIIVSADTSISFEII